MIIEPIELLLMAREAKSQDMERHEAELVAFHSAHKVNDHNAVVVPMYWAETLLLGLKKMREEFPRMRFGSVIEEKNKLRMTTVPAHLQVVKMKIALYNEIDKLILNTIDRLTKGDKKSSFLL